MPRRPGDTEPDPPGGRAAERLREFIDQRFPGRSPSKEGGVEGDRRDEERKERDDADREERHSE
jgi:hypothetical protein